MILTMVSCVALLASSPDTLSYTVNFSENDLTFTTLSGYDHVSLANSSFIVSPGYPSLPRTPLLFVIPAGTYVSDVEFSVSNLQAISGIYSIYPSQPEIFISDTVSNPFTPPDSAIYSLASPWPSYAAWGTDLGSMDVTKLACVYVYPLAWNPGSGELLLRKSIEVRLILETDTLPSPTTVTLTSACWDERVRMLESIVVNPDSIEQFSNPPNLVNENTRGTDNFPVALECMIITRDAWRANWQPLINWNIKKGLFTEIISVEEIEAKADILWDSGRDWPETIRNCIRWLHNNRGVQYVLLGTDTTPPVSGQYSDDEAPMRYCKLYKEMTQCSGYTDWYYACLDPINNWQTNNNPPWGEYYPPNGPIANDYMDLIPDVAVGRVPVHTASEVTDFVATLISYQKHNFFGSNPSSDLLIVSAAAEVPGFPDNWEHVQAITSVVPTYIEKTWLAEQGCGVPGALEISPQGLLDLLDGSVQSGGFYRVNFGGHGGDTWIGANPFGEPANEGMILSTQLSTLSGDGGKYCSGYAYNCMTGSFVYDQSTQTIIKTWLGCDETLLNAPLGPTYIGNGNQGINSTELGGSTSHKLNEFFLASLYNGQTGLGEWSSGNAYNIASVQFAAEFLDGYPDVIPQPDTCGNVIFEPMWDLRVNNLGGDPASPLWLRDPMIWVSDYPSEIRCPADITISVESTGGVAISGVRVCLLMEATQGFEIYKRGYTDSSGEFTVNLNPTFTGVLSVTLTKQGYLPDEGQVRLLVD